MILNTRCKCFEHRIWIQTDVYALARAGHATYVDYLKLLRHAYKHEDNLTVWKSILRQLVEFGSLLEYAKIANTKPLFKSFVCELLSNIYSKLEWDPTPNEGAQAPMLRSQILTQMGLCGHKATKDEAHKRFARFFIENNDTAHHLVNPNIRGVIYVIVAKTGNQQTFEQLKSLYNKADSQEERIRLLTALCRFDDETIQRQALDFVWNATEVRKQDHLTGFASIANHNRQGRELCWTYLQENWDKIEHIYGEHDTHLIHFIENVPAFFVSEDRAEEVRKFYIAHPNPLLDRSIKKVIEQINIRRVILERNEANVNQFLIT